MVQDGLRGVSTLAPVPVDEHVEDPATYGIDWQVAADRRLMDHLLENNPHEQQHPDNPFSIGPTTLSDVPCVPPDCPLTAPQIQSLDAQLNARMDLSSRNMEVRRLVWINALAICRELFTGLM